MNRINNNNVSWVICLACLVMLSLGVNGSDNSSSKSCHRDTVVVAVEMLPPLLDPVVAITHQSFRVIHSIFDQLIYMDFKDGFRLKPGLAKSWRRIDELSIELKLRDDVVFHDGTPFDAAAVAFTFSRSRLDRAGATAFALSRPFIGTIDKVTIVDKYTVIISSAKPDPVLEYRLAGWMSQPVSPKALSESPSPNQWARAPVGTGPYRVTEFIAGERITLTANNKYWRGQPKYSSIIFQVVPEQSARIAGLVSGRYDMITNLDPDLFDYVLSYPELDVVGGAIANHRVVSFGTHHPMLAKPEIRRAMSLAINRQKLVKELWHGKVAVSPGMQLPLFGDMFLENYSGIPYDPDKAKQLIAQSDYHNEEIPFYIQKNTYTAELIFSEALVSMWQDVGLNVRLKIKDNWGQILLPEPSYIYNSSVNAIFPDPLGSMWRYFGENSRTQKHKEWSNQEFNRLGHLLEFSLDNHKRQKAFLRMLQIIEWEDPAYILLHTYGLFYGKRRDLDWSPTLGSYMQFPLLENTQECTP
jgi:peptide/nickel transport system substrate-binding protein